MRVFISYCHSDATDQAEKIADYLRQQRHVVFIDRDLRPGEDWLNGITRALDQADAMIALISRDLKNSTYCTCERNRALNRIPRIVPVVVHAEAEIPLNFEHLQRLDFSNQINPNFFLLDDALNANVNKQPQPYRTPQTPIYGRPPLPTLCQPRQTLVEKVVQALILDGTPENRIVALTAKFGMGKTTVANLVCRDERVKAAFPDGIIWCGVSKGVLSIPPTFVRAIDGQPAADFDAHFVRDRLQDKAVLFVLENVDAIDEIEAFLSDNPRCRLLVTTRNPDLVRFEAATEIEIGSFSPYESVSLLRQYYRRDDGNLERLASHFQHWPIAIRIVGATIRGKSEGAPAELLSSLESGGTLPSELARLLTAATECLSATHLTFFLHLAQFPRRVAIPEDFAIRLWRVLASRPVSSSSATVFQPMVDAGLLEHDNHLRGYLMHDVIRDYGRQLMDPAHCAAAHSTIFRVCQPRNADWTSLDDYALRYLPYHLARAERFDDLCRLLLDTNWYVRKVAAGGPGLQSLILDHKPVLDRDNDLALLEGALRLSQRTLTTDPAQLAAQLSARLNGQGSDRLRQFLADLYAHTPTPRLRVLSQSLTSPAGALRSNLADHLDQVHQVAFSPDGSSLYSVSDDGYLRRWDRANAQLQESASAHETCCKALTVTPAGLPVTGSDDGFIKLWSATLEPIVTLRSPCPVRALAADCDGRLISGGDDGWLRVWNPLSDTPALEWHAHSGRVRSILLLPDGKLLSGAEDGRILLWDIDQRTAIRLWFDGDVPVWSLALGGHPLSLVSAHADCSVRVWDFFAPQRPRKLERHQNIVTSVLFLDDSRLVSGSLDNDLVVWDLQHAQPACVLSEHTQQIRGLALSADRKWLASASADRTVKIWDTHRMSVDAQARAHHERVVSVAITADGRSAVTASRDKSVNLWQAGFDRPVRQSVASGPLYAIDISAPLQCIVSAVYEERSVLVSALETGDTIICHLGIGPVTHIRVSCDGLEAVIACSDQSIYRFNLRTPKVPPELVAQGQTAITALAISSNAASTLIASADCSLSELNLTSRHPRVLGQTPGVVCSLDLSPDDSEVLLGMDDGRVGVWNRSTPLDAIALTSAHADNVCGLAFVSKGTRVLTASHDKTVRLWDSTLLRRLATFEADGQFVSLAVSHDSPETVVLGDITGSVHFLRIEEAAAAAVA